MYWKKMIRLVTGTGWLVAGLSSAAFAGDHHHIISVTVQAPIDAINCQALPATVSLLGLTIDVSNASFGSNWRHGNGGSLTCANLTVGQTVDVNLAADIPDATTGLLTATEVNTRGDNDKSVIIAAPLQAVDPGGANVTALGLVVDISKATLLNDKHAVAASQIMADQFAAIKLASNQAPLAASTLQVDINQVEVQAPVDATNCQAVPATISLLGFNIDVSKATFGSNRNHGNSPVLTCADLTAGQTVGVYLTGDTPDATTGLLTATDVEAQGNRHNDVKIAAPLQIVDPAGTNVTVLGQVVDISKATLLSDHEEQITATQLKMGQFAGIGLASNQAPLAASALQVHIDEVTVQAPLDVVNCQAIPPTASLLGLTIDLSKASFGPAWRRWHGDTSSCADLTVGQVAAVELVSDLPDPTTGLLTATEVASRGGQNNGVKIAAPLQAIDPSGANVTALGLVVDISKATLRDDNLHTIIANQLAQGQFAGLNLASNQAPLSATQLVAESGIHEVRVSVRDEKGKLVKDAAADVKAEVTVTIAKKVHKIQTASNGAIHLAGLPAGRATIVVTRVKNGKTSKATATFMIKAKGTNNVMVQLKTVH
jgi:hypothetical protein